MICCFEELSLSAHQLTFGLSVSNNVRSYITQPHVGGTGSFVKNSCGIESGTSRWHFALAASKRGVGAYARNFPSGILIGQSRQGNRQNLKAKPFSWPLTSRLWPRLWSKTPVRVVGIGVPQRIN
ncbi:hypothetical protein TWF173_001597 [Orbilia oligospora]|uniref:Uncharacterized protein n=1 Tax=Orbilia oligospora TaxID=2813651 RepID=A0A7C8VKX3_ORBOL|nr:hypothetical protein TWF970_008564 [Orbilia oligospora]KAF3308229.1 hypothetical protein TWF173_001597 [Orbilia oligospora]